MVLELAIPSISDFVENIWRRAKVELGELDGNFLSAIDHEVRLDNLGLAAPWPSAIERRPQYQLPDRWHQLLESCLELEIQADCLMTAASLLNPGQFITSDPEYVGKTAIINWRSWFVHALSLAERSESVIAKTIQP